MAEAERLTSPGPLEAASEPPGAARVGYVAAGCERAAGRQLHGYGARQNRPHTRFFALCTSYTVTRARSDTLIQQDKTLTIHGNSENHRITSLASRMKQCVAALQRRCSGVSACANTANGAGRDVGDAGASHRQQGGSGSSPEAR